MTDWSDSLNGTHRALALPGTYEDSRMISGDRAKTLTHHAEVGPGHRRSWFGVRTQRAIAVLIWLSLGALYPSGSQAQVGGDSAGPGTVAARAAMTDSTGVQPGDLIRLKVWREPDMSGDVVVDARGEATLPRLGAVRVSSWAPESLRSYLVSSYAKYLRDPAVEVTVLPRVTILGAVRNPGVQNVDPTLTIADALALAGGVAGDGKQGKIELRRRGAKVPVSLSMTARLADTPVRSGDQLFVPQRSWLSRNPGVVLGVASFATSIIFFALR
jgi:protein involved in polysaccharide export with SLBB domain